MADRGEMNTRWGAASYTLGGAAHCGDAYYARESVGGGIFAVVDGLGHGREAERAARCAMTVLAQRDDLPLSELVRSCHRAQRGLRGVVMSLVRVDYERRNLSWLGIGNVTGVLLRGRDGAAEHLLAGPGIVGANLPPLREATLPIGDGDALLLATDGVVLDTLPRLRADEPAQSAAARLLHERKTNMDDALVLVARMGG